MNLKTEGIEMTDENTNSTITNNPIYTQATADDPLTDDFINN